MTQGIAVKTVARASSGMTSYQSICFGLLVLIVIAGCWLFLSTLASHQVQTLIHQEHEALLLSDRTLSESLKPPVLILRSLQKESAIHQALARFAQGQPEALQLQLSSIASRYNSFHQVSYFSPRGELLLQVARDADGVQLSSDQPQQPADATDISMLAQQLQPGQVYLSDISANGNTADRTLTHPELKATALALDSAGARRGVFVINKDMNGALQQLPGESSSATWLVNSRGNWLRAPESAQPSDAAASFIGEPWNSISKTASGKLRTEAGYYLWAGTRSPLATVSAGNDRYPEVLRFIKFIPEQRLREVYIEVVKQWLPLLAALALGGLLLVYVLFRKMNQLSLARVHTSNAKEVAAISQRARQAEQEALQLLQSNINGILSVDATGTIHTINPAAERIFGYQPGELVGQNISVLIPTGHAEHHDQYVKNFSASTDTSRPMAGRSIFGIGKDGRKIPLEVSLSKILGSEPLRTSATIIDLSERYDAEARINYLQKHDLLTGLPNRFELNLQLNTAIERAHHFNSRILVNMIDLDYFKHINDSLGHETGDSLIIQVAERLKESSETGRAYVSRICGDEFVVLLDGLDATLTLEPQVAAIKQLFERPFTIDERAIWIRVSIGSSAFPEDGTEASVLLRNADSALFEAKHRGRNTYQFYSKDLTEKALRRHYIENSLHNAIEKNEFFLMYQPQIELNRKELVGLEALLRWRHPELGLVSPAEFIPIAESMDLIETIGTWVIRTACRQAAEWLAGGFDFGQMSINISGSQLNTGTLVDHIYDTLVKFNLCADRLCLEITEGYVMDQLHGSISQLQQLRELGVSLAIDDFGTGFSSLGRLKSLPFSKLKIDRSFVIGLPSDQNDVAICKAIIALADSLEMDIVVEGVENIEQLDFFAALGCKYIQGFYFSKPLAGDELAARYSMASNPRKYIATAKNSPRH